MSGEGIQSQSLPTTGSLSGLLPGAHTVRRNPRPDPRYAELLPPATREDGSPVTLLSVKDGECRFPCGAGIGGALVLCGHPVKAGAVYCEDHRRIACIRPQKAG